MIFDPLMRKKMELRMKIAYFLRFKKFGKFVKIEFKNDKGRISCYILDLRRSKKVLKFIPEVKKAKYKLPLTIANNHHFLSTFLKFQAEMVEEEARKVVNYVKQVIRVNQKSGCFFFREEILNDPLVTSAEQVCRTFLKYPKKGSKTPKNRIFVIGEIGPKKAKNGLFGPLVDKNWLHLNTIYYMSKDSRGRHGLLVDYTEAVDKSKTLTKADNRAIKRNRLFKAFEIKELNHQKSQKTENFDTEQKWPIFEFLAKGEIRTRIPDEKESYSTNYFHIEVGVDQKCPICDFQQERPEPLNAPHSPLQQGLRG